MDQNFQFDAVDFDNLNPAIVREVVVEVTFRKYDEGPVQLTSVCPGLGYETTGIITYLGTVNDPPGVVNTADGFTCPDTNGCPDIARLNPLFGYNVRAVAGQQDSMKKLEAATFLNAFLLCILLCFYVLW